MNRTITIFLFGLFADFLLAQSIMSLRDCMEYAIEHSVNVEIQRTHIDDARIARCEAILKAFTPTIDAGTYAYLNFGRSVDPETNTYLSTTSFNNGYSVAGSLVLFNGFSAVNNMKISKIAMKMGITQEQQIVDELCLAVMEAYCNALYFSQLVEVMKVQVETMSENLQLAQRQEQLGEKSHADVVQLEADLAEREYQYITIKNQLDDAMLTLQDLMLWEEQVCLSIQTDWTFHPFLQDSVGDIPQHPAVALAEYKMQNAKTELNSARWRFAPSLSLSGGWSTSYYTYPNTEGYVATPYAQQFVNNGGEYVQLSMSIPIYDGLSRYSNIARKENAYRRAEAEYRRTQQEVESEVKRAMQDRDGAMAAFKLSDRRAKAQQEAYIINTKKFEQGLISPIELKTSSDNYLNAQAEYINASLKCFIKTCVVNYYNGVSYINQLK
ncbi:MAG: TolC family protein [Paludibacteraceae bacterium]|nr:TolC family protein [Paludibacteraceae bacterium]